MASHSVHTASGGVHGGNVIAANDKIAV